MTYLTDIPGEDELMDMCWRWAHGVYRSDNVIHHEWVARHLGGFLTTRVMEQQDTAERAALLSVVSSLTRTATYASNGVGPIKQAMAVMLRLALPYRGHPDWQEEYGPGSAA